MQSKQPSKSVVASAESIFSSMMKGESPKTQTQSPQNPTATKEVKYSQPDIRSVKVSDSFAAAICEATTGKKVAVNTPSISEDKVSSESKLESLVTRLADLIREAKSVLSEMTTAGAIGVNNKFVLSDKNLKKKKQNGLAKTNKRD